MCYIGSCGNKCHTGMIQIIAYDHMSTSSTSSTPLGQCRECGDVGRFVSAPQCGQERPLGGF